MCVVVVVVVVSRMTAIGQIRLTSPGTLQLGQCVSPFGKKARYVNRAQFLISRASSSKEAELKKMQEYKENVSKNLEKAASAGRCHSWEHL